MKAALFDLDGVLIDTEGIYSSFWSAMADRYNVPIPNFADYIKGTTLSKILEGHFPVDEQPKIIEMLKEFEQNMEYRCFPGVISFLDQLKALEIPMAIVTSSGEMKMSRLWQQIPELREYFNVIITDAMVQRSKPDPEGYLLAAKALNQNAADCCVFEDSFNGIEAGKRAGCKVIGLATTNPYDTLTDKADLVIKSFEGIDATELPF